MSCPETKGQSSNILMKKTTVDTLDLGLRRALEWMLLSP